MADCLLNNLKHNRSSKILIGCGHFDVYSEINGPRKMAYQAASSGSFFRRNQQPMIGYALDDGSVDYNDTITGKRIFFPQHFRIREIHSSFPNATWILNWRDFDSWIESVMQWGDNDNLHYQFLNEYLLLFYRSQWCDII